MSFDVLDWGREALPVDEVGADDVVPVALAALVPDVPDALVEPAPCAMCKAQCTRHRAHATPRHSVLVMWWPGGERARADDEQRMCTRV